MEVRLNVGDQFPQISGPAADEFAAELIRLEDSDFETVVLDFAGTEYINSMAMGSIFASFQKLSEQDRNLKLVNVNDKIRRILKVANLMQIMEPEE